MAAATNPSMLDRKLKLMERLSCHDLFLELESLDEQMISLVARQADLDREIRQRQAELAEAEALAALNVEGKNETERKARKIEALHADVAYQTALDTLRVAEAELAQTSSALEALKRKARRVERRIEYQTAILRFLGGS